MSTQSLCVITVFMPETWDNKSGPGDATNVIRDLTRSSVRTREKAPMNDTQTCSVDGCERDVRTRRMCQKHYLKAWRRGDIDLLPPTTPIERLLSHYLVPTEPDACIPWTGKPSPQNYGWVSIDGKIFTAHRVMYLMFVGPIPDGLVPDHLCHTRDLSCPGGPCAHRLCGRPDHLELVTQGENVLRGRSPMADNARKTHCPQGHPYDAANTWVDKHGYRACRTCNRDRGRARRALNTPLWKG